MSAEYKQGPLTTNQCMLIHSSCAVLALGMREASKITITGNFYENTSSFKFVFHEIWLPFKRLDFNTVKALISPWGGLLNFWPSGRGAY